MRSFVCVFLMSAALLSGGCAGEKADYEKKVTELDPLFKEKLDKKSAFLKQLAEQKSLYLEKKQKVDEQIGLLKAKQYELGRQYALSIDKIKQQFDPERRQLRNELSELELKYRGLADELSNVNKGIREIGKLVGKKDDLSLSQEEFVTWNNRLEDLTRKKEQLESESANLRGDIELTKMKIKVMKI